MSVGRHAVAYSQAAITLRPGSGQARITHLPPDAVAGRQRAHYPFTLEPSLPLLLPNPSLHETQQTEESNTDYTLFHGTSTDYRLFFVVRDPVTDFSDYTLFQLSKKRVIGKSL